MNVCFCIMLCEGDGTDLDSEVDMYTCTDAYTPSNQGVE